MSVIVYILIFTFIGSLASLVGGIVLLTREKFALRISHYLASFAAGTLLGAAFFDLLPEAAHEAQAARSGQAAETNIFLFALLGILIFFLMERFIHWFHHHEEFHEHEKETKSTVPLIIISDTMHNFVDGVVIAATFLISIPLGIVTTLAVAAHEIPQEIGDFGLLLHKGMPKKKIILINILSASAAFLGVFATLAVGEVIHGYIPMFLSLTAGFFIYIAASDLIPEIHYEKNRKTAVIQSLLLLAGVGLVWIAISMLGEFHR